MVWYFKDITINDSMTEADVLSKLKEPVWREITKTHIFLFYMKSNTNDQGDFSIYLVTLKINPETFLSNVINVEKKM